jgi:hypothetical protein
MSRRRAISDLLIAMQFAVLIGMKGSRERTAQTFAVEPGVVLV